ncbi:MULTISPECIES: hypothetical protein [Mumia]|uniref:hypothetical protein n=1 Tax=Mumia TaxID=1546255 RepID=UPI001422041E|nr:hypothetical protein [Mumia sp. ZJ430]
MPILDLDQQDLSWFDLVPAGADQSTRMCALWSDDERGLRTVLVDFPDGWHRDATGNQPAQEEMVALSGAMRVSGLRAGVGELLVGPPRATRAETSNEDGTRVIVWFSGQSGGWSEGPADPPREMRVVDLAPGVVRPAEPGLNGSIEVREEVAGAVFDVDVDLLWASQQRWVHLAAGEVAPAVPGQVVVKRWA